jgi:uncharacterized membrane protein YebE (DUF533 family)
MGFLDDLGSLLNAAVPQGQQQNQARNQSGGLGELLGPGVLGGLTGAFLPGKGGALKTGGAAALASMLWNKYKDRILPPEQTASASPAMPQAAVAASASPATVRLIRAMVFAAKSDGRIDDQEQAAINDRLGQLQAGPETAQLAAQALNEPLDPHLVADGVSDPQEAMALFLASCAVIKADQFMENTYLEALAKALGVPADMIKDIEAEAHKN